MFIDEIKLKVKAGDGGDGVLRWKHEKFRPNSGPSGGNGGRGGGVFVRAVRDLSLLSKYTGSKEFKAENGEPGRNDSQHGKNGDDVYIDVPVGSFVTEEKTGRAVELTEEGQVEKMLMGGAGGLGNEHFKSSTNRSPEETTKGKLGEEGVLHVELKLLVDVGLVGMPNAGKSTLINSLTNTKANVGSYPFTTLEPQLGDLFGFVIADIPGLIEGAAEGKGLGHKFLRHIERTKMLLHLVPLDVEDPLKQYYAISKELSDYNESLINKEEWIILTKKDLINKDELDSVVYSIDKNNKRVFVISCLTGEGVKELRDSLVLKLREG